MEVDEQKVTEVVNEQENLLSTGTAVKTKRSKLQVQEHEIKTHPQAQQHQQMATKSNKSDTDHDAHGIICQDAQTRNHNNKKTKEKTKKQVKVKVKEKKDAFFMIDNFDQLTINTLPTETSECWLSTSATLNSNNNTQSLSVSPPSLAASVTSEPPDTSRDSTKIVQGNTGGRKTCSKKSNEKESRFDVDDEPDSSENIEGEGSGIEAAEKALMRQQSITSFITCRKIKSDTGTSTPTPTPLPLPPPSDLPKDPNVSNNEPTSSKHIVDTVSSVTTRQPQKGKFTKRAQLLPATDKPTTARQRKLAMSKCDNKDMDNQQTEKSQIVDCEGSEGEEEFFSHVDRFLSWRQRRIAVENVSAETADGLKEDLKVKVEVIQVEVHHEENDECGIVSSSAQKREVSKERNNNDHIYKSNRDNSRQLSGVSHLMLSAETINNSITPLRYVSPVKALNRKAVFKELKPSSSSAPSLITPTKSSPNLPETSVDDLDANINSDTETTVEPDTTQNNSAAIPEEPDNVKVGSFKLPDVPVSVQSTSGAENQRITMMTELLKEELSEYESRADESNQKEDIQTISFEEFQRSLQPQESIGSESSPQPLVQDTPKGATEKIEEYSSPPTTKSPGESFPGVAESNTDDVPKQVHGEYKEKFMEHEGTADRNQEQDLSEPAVEKIEIENELTEDAEPKPQVKPKRRRKAQIYSTRRRKKTVASPKYFIVVEDEPKMVTKSILRAARRISRGALLLARRSSVHFRRRSTLTGSNPPSGMVRSRRRKEKRKVKMADTPCVIPVTPRADKIPGEWKMPESPTSHTVRELPDIPLEGRGGVEDKKSVGKPKDKETDKTTDNLNGQGKGHSPLQAIESDEVLFNFVDPPPPPIAGARRRSARRSELYVSGRLESSSCSEAESSEKKNYRRKTVATGDIDQLQQHQQKIKNYLHAHVSKSSSDESTNDKNQRERDDVMPPPSTFPPLPYNATDTPNGTRASGRRKSMGLFSLASYSSSNENNSTTTVKRQTESTEGAASTAKEVTGQPKKHLISDYFAGSPPIPAAFVVEDEQARKRASINKVVTRSRRRSGAEALLAPTPASPDDDHFEGRCLTPPPEEKPQPPKQRAKHHNPGASSSGRRPRRCLTPPPPVASESSETLSPSQEKSKTTTKVRKGRRSTIVNRRVEEELIQPQQEKSPMKSESAETVDNGEEDPPSEMGSTRSSSAPTTPANSSPPSPTTSIQSLPSPHSTLTLRRSKRSIVIAATKPNRAESGKKGGRRGRTVSASSAPGDSIKIETITEADEEAEMDVSLLPSVVVLLSDKDILREDKAGKTSAKPSTKTRRTLRGGHQTENDKGQVNTKTGTLDGYIKEEGKKLHAGTRRSTRNVAASPTPSTSSCPSPHTQKRGRKRKEKATERKLKSPELLTIEDDEEDEIEPVEVVKLSNEEEWKKLDQDTFKSLSYDFAPFTSWKDLSSPSCVPDAPPTPHVPIFKELNESYEIPDMHKRSLSQELSTWVRDAGQDNAKSMREYSCVEFPPSGEETGVCVDEWMGMGVEKSLNLSENRLWTDIFRPSSRAEFCGNSRSARDFHSWLSEWKKRLLRTFRKEEKMKNQREKPGTTYQSTKKRKRNLSPDDSDSEYSRDSYSSEDEGGLCNVHILSGPTGVGKSCLAYAIGKELGFKVIELGANQHRSGRQIESVLKGATDSHRIKFGSRPQEDTPGGIMAAFSKCATTKNDERSKSKKQKISEDIELLSRTDSTDSNSTATSQSEPTSPCRFSMILFDDVDITFYNDDGFWTGIRNILAVARIPVVITCKDWETCDLEQLEVRRAELRPLQITDTVPYVRGILYGVLRSVIPEEKVKEICSFFKNDLRKILLSLQYSLANTPDDIQPSVLLPEKFIPAEETLAPVIWNLASIKNAAILDTIDGRLKARRIPGRFRRARLCDGEGQAQKNALKIFSKPNSDSVDRFLATYDGAFRQLLDSPSVPVEGAGHQVGHSSKVAPKGRYTSIGFLVDALGEQGRGAMNATGSLESLSVDFFPSLQQMCLVERERNQNKRENKRFLHYFDLIGIDPHNKMKDSYCNPRLRTDSTSA